MRLFEFTDQPWYPPVFRRMQTDYLQFVATQSAAHQRRLLPLFRKALEHAGTQEIIDLCSGGSGPWLSLREYFKEGGLEVQVTLTDIYPTPEAVQRWVQDRREGITYLAEPVDALAVPDHLPGMRTLFEGFHHFPPADARRILQDAVEKRAAIGVVEASLKPPLGWLFLLFSPLMTVLAYLLITPLLKPRAWWRFLWTYLLPMVPLATCWDGVVSLLRVYAVGDLQTMIADLGGEDYRWEIGVVPSSMPALGFTYLIGYPV